MFTLANIPLFKLPVAVLVFFTTAARARVVATDFRKNISYSARVIRGGCSSLLRLLLSLLILRVLVLHVLHLQGLGRLSFCLLNLFLCLNPHRHQ